jgi:hypothetical protein
MYALIHNSSLILGPMQFNSRMFTSVLEDDLEIEYKVSPRDYQYIPIHIDENTHIVPAIQDVPEHDGRTHSAGNFTWNINYDENNVPSSVTFTYPVFEKPLEQVKAERKQEVTPVRREKENTTISVSINETTVNVSTSREERLSFVSKLVSSPGPHQFKFDGGVWVELDNTALQNLVTQIDAKVQEAFDWELAKTNEIDACISAEEVLAVVVREQPPAQEQELTPREKRLQELQQPEE